MSEIPQVVAVGDIHGEFDALEQLLDRFLPTNRTIVLLGDYVNRGPRAREVLQTLRDLHEAAPDRFIVLRGNHENALLRFLAGGAIEDFAAYGGLATISSFLPDTGVDDPISSFRAVFPKELETFVSQMPSFHETQDYLFSHSGFDPNDVGLRTESAMCGDGNPRIFGHDGPWPKSRTIFGHFVQTTRAPFVSEHLVCLDTGCGTIPGAPLTAYDLADDKFIEFESREADSERLR